MLGLVKNSTQPTSGSLIQCGGGPNAQGWNVPGRRITSGPVSPIVEETCYGPQAANPTRCPTCRERRRTQFRTESAEQREIRTRAKSSMGSWNCWRKGQSRKSGTHRLQSEPAFRSRSCARRSGQHAPSFPLTRRKSTARCSQRAGFSASLAAMQHKLRFVTIEQESFGGTVAHFPRGKLVMTAPATLPMIGKVKFREISKEKLLAFWARVAKKTGLKVRYGERVDAVVPTGGDFEIKTTQRVYRARSVLLTIGRRGTPRKLDVPGEDQPKVVYRLIDPQQYRGQHVLVVGGGDSALEAAASIAEERNTQVTLSYRSEAFARAKLKNRQRVDAAQQAGRLNVLFRSRGQANWHQRCRNRAGRQTKSHPERRCHRVRGRHSTDLVPPEHGN